MIQWTITAKRRLRAALAGRLCAVSHGRNGKMQVKRGREALAATMADLNTFLSKTSPGYDIVVKDVMTGYRPKKGQHTLLVEVIPPASNPGPMSPQNPCIGTGAYVVKIGRAKALRRERAAWETCRPEGLKVDLVFLPLHKGFQKGRGPRARMAIYYGDAHQFLGVDRVVLFEEAALDAILYDHPSSTSVGLVLWELFERIAHLLYVQSFEDDPVSAIKRARRQSKEKAQNAARNPIREIKHLSEALSQWSSGDPLMLRRRANSVLCGSRHGPTEFLDPIDYLNSIDQILEPAPKRKPRARNAGLPKPPRVADVLPRMLRGCAHGDLHGRNILVAAVRGKILWPTVFDYEDMGPCNLLGWDFVKLETELKIRAYNEIFDGSDPHYIRTVQQFERELGLATEARHRGEEPWGVVTGADTPQERLRKILLEIRHRAAVHLGIERGRPNDWLEEYYFLLACYGVCTVRFRNQNCRQRLAALISAGAAAARLSWPRRMLAELPTP